MIDLCDEATATARYGAARNAKIVRERKTGQVVRVLLASHGDDSSLRSEYRGNSASIEYTERCGERKVHAVQRYNEQTGEFLYWSDADGFNPRRWNPDMVRSSAVNALT